MPRKSMSDASVPNAGRIDDYLLGGHHNFDPGGSGYGIYLIKWGRAK
jgi:hypothetical protein